jgi:putative transposase
MNMEQFNDLKRLAVMYRTGRVSLAFIVTYFGLSRRHVSRLIHDLCPPKKRSAWNRLPDDIRGYLLETKRDHPNYNCQWLSELASDRFGRVVSQTSVWRVLQKAGLLQLPDRKGPSPLRKRFEAKASGDLIQMDTSWGYWLGDRKLYLILLLDDHSRMILHGQFFFEETLWHNMTMIRETIEKHGIFKVLYTDNASWFKVIRHDKSLYQKHYKQEYESEITRACRDLGIVHVTHKPYEPQGKGKVERIFRFIQERFVSEIDDPHMGLWLVNKKWKAWMHWYNTRHENRTTGEVPQKRFNPKGFKPLSTTKSRGLDDIFCLKDTRTVDACNQFSYQGRLYTVPGSRSFAHQKLDLHIAPNRKIRLWHTGLFVGEVTITP